ncbi:LysR family transcriptional regulator [Vulgatibacter sp.]|uniref:LysR family transcriptional regulator n=1 Tax=Vulgatibacter sp. TaxID=1971226 RepID=UPI003562FF17
MSAFDLELLPSMALFARVVQLQSFSAAARQSGIAKSGVSKRITQLEKRLGVQLLRRSTRKLALTAEGLRFYEHCARVLEEASAAQAAVATATSEARGVLRVSAPVTFSQMYLAAAVAEFLDEYPEVEVHLTTDDRLTDMVEGRFDVVVRVGRLADSSAIARRLAADRLVVCASPDYLERAGVPETPEALVGHNCLHYANVPLSGEWRFRSPERSYSVPARGNFVATDGTVLRRAALAGLGLAVVPYFMVASDVEAGRLRLVLGEHRRAEIGIYAMVTESKRLPVRTRVFLDFLVRYFAQPRWTAAPRPQRAPARDSGRLGSGRSRT